VPVAASKDDSAEVARLLGDAEAQLAQGDHERAWDLAVRAFAASPSPRQERALYTVQFKSACKGGDVARANQILRKLSPALRKFLITSCPDLTLQP
jgi:hypothetical protein